MTEPRTLRLIDDPPERGSWNMAVDQALLQTANERARPTLRVYRWEPATLSLGYFQRHDDRAGHRASRDCPVVRRSSGGGAILHDRELTYSLCLPAAHRWSDDHARLYRLVHEVLVELLADAGVEAALYGDPGVPAAGLTRESESGVAPRIEPHIEPRIEGNPKAFLCFERRTPGDLVQTGWKIGGSAQRRLENALIQHGSLLLGRSPCAPELPGVADLAPQFEMESFVNCFVDEFAGRLAKALNVELEKGELSGAEAKLAEGIEVNRFGQVAWTKKR